MTGRCFRIGPNKYRLVFDIPKFNAKRRQKTVTFDGAKKQAEAELTRLIQLWNSGRILDDGKLCVAHLFQRLFEEKADRLAPNTLKRYKQLARHLEPHIGHFRIAELRKAHLLAAYGQARVGHKTIKHIDDFIRNVLNRAVKWDLLQVNVALAIDHHDLPRIQKRKMAFLTDSQLRVLLEAARHPSKRSESRNYLTAEPAWCSAVVFLAYTGTRRGECLALRWSDVNMETGEAVIRRSLQENMEYKPPKTWEIRTITLSPDTLSMLRAHRATQVRQRLALGAAYKDEDLIFARGDGSPIPPWSMTASFRDFVSKLDIPRIRLHDLRHSHASLLIKAGVRIEVVSRRLGHKSIQTTMDFYGHIDREQHEQAALAFDALVG